MSPLLQSYRSLLLAVLSLLLVLVILFACTVGSMDISIGQIVHIIAAHLHLPVSAEGFTPAQDSVVWAVRLPRVLFGVLIGASLALTGAAMQGLFRNPLADPGLLGISAGGSMGVIIAIVFGSTLFSAFPLVLRQAMLPICSILGSLGATLLVYNLSRVRGRTHATTMLLTGIAVNGLASSVVGTGMYIASNEQLREYSFWHLGSLGRAAWPVVFICSICIIPMMWVLCTQARALNAFLLGESEAWHLGINVQRVKRLIICVTAAMVGVGVAYCGVISFLGLIVPHLVRMLIGPDHRWLMPGSILAGAILLVSADLTARTVVTPSELPIGVITAFFGAPFFFFLLSIRKRNVR
ncbi:MAG: iron ABC transporter permease [Opitutales bacterium]|nr:iron ABC transporter permease [Opitutales bacterium]